MRAPVFFGGPLDVLQSLFGFWGGRLWGAVFFFLFWKNIFLVLGSFWRRAKRVLIGNMLLRPHGLLTSRFCRRFFRGGARLLLDVLLSVS